MNPTIRAPCYKIIKQKMADNVHPWTCSSVGAPRGNQPVQKIARSVGLTTNTNVNTMKPPNIDRILRSGSSIDELRQTGEVDRCWAKVSNDGR